MRNLFVTTFQFCQPAHAVQLLNLNCSYQKSLNFKDRGKAKPKKTLDEAINYYISCLNSLQQPNDRIMSDSVIDAAVENHFNPTINLLHKDIGDM